MKRVTIPNEFWRQKAMFFEQHDGKLGLMYPKENLACPLMLFNATVPLYDVDYMPDTYEEACQQIVTLKRRIAKLEQRDTA